jgi:hypothetical protein
MLMFCPLYELRYYGLESTMTGESTMVSERAMVSKRTMES